MVISMVKKRQFRIVNSVVKKRQFWGVIRVVKKGAVSDGYQCG